MTVLTGLDFAEQAFGHQELLGTAYLVAKRAELVDMPRCSSNWIR
jgi:hypothetical protein